MAQFQEQRCVGDDGRQRIHREKPSRRMTRAIVTGWHPNGLWQDWENDLYYGSLREMPADISPFGTIWKVIGISAKAEDARHDWREFQQIKNDLVGEEWEGIEFYPAEDRLVDPSNRFYIWCFPRGTVLSLIGFQQRKVEGPHDGGAPQRPFPE